MKADIWEAGHRVPFVARWPRRIKARTTCHDLGCLVDLFATVADLVEAKLPRNAAEDSYSWLPSMLGQPATRDSVVHHSADGVFAIRQGDWKLCLGRGSGGFSEPKAIPARAGEPAGELYDLRSDPFELENVYAREPGKVKALTALLEGMQREGRSRLAE
jgi:arylsulfatase A-like enzyme